MTTITNEAAEKLLHDLVATPSPSRQEHAASTLLVQWMNAHGYRAHVDEVDNAIGVVGAADVTKTIVLLGHIDTFAGNPPVRLNGRKLYGRGSVDAKGPLCTFTVAAARANLPDNVQVVVVGAVEEEAATSKGARHIAPQYQPDACVIGEPSNWDRITLGYKGRLLVDWQWRGALAHSAGPVLSPAEHAFSYWERVRDFADAYNASLDKDTLFGRLDASLRDVRTEQDGTDGVATMTLGFRLPPAVDIPDLLKSISPNNGASIRPYGAEDAYTSDRDSILARALRGAVRANGGKPKFLYKTGTADMNVVGPVWDCPIVAYGPGDSNLDHTPDEHIDLDEYLRAIDVLTDALERLSKSLNNT